MLKKFLFHLVFSFIFLLVVHVAYIAATGGMPSNLIEVGIGMSCMFIAAQFRLGQRKNAVEFGVTLLGFVLGGAGALALALLYALSKMSPC